jgi:hydroxyacylglutathione hydrolase
MEGVHDYGCGISAVDSRLVRDTQTAVHIIVEEGRAAIVDTATADCVPRVLQALAGKGVAPDRVDFVILTHVHLDHAAGAGRLMQCCPNAKLTVHPRGARHMIDPSRLMAATVEIYGADAARRMYGEVVPIPEQRVIETGEGTFVCLAGRQFRFFDAPGHARHHVVVRDSRSGRLFAGDTFGLSYRELDVGGRQFSFPTTSPSQFDPPALHASIDRMLAMEPEAVYVTHFGELRDVHRLAADLHRLIDAHVDLALDTPGAGSERLARLEQGIKKIVLAEALRQGWRLPETELMRVFSLDIELNAQGLAAWLDARARGARAAN